MDRGLRYLIYISLLILTLITGVAGGGVLDHYVITPRLAAQNTSTNSSQPDYKLIGEAWNIVQKTYVDRSALDQTKLTYGAISGMIDALGDTGHSRFMSPDMLKSENRELQGEFEGIGVTVGTKDGLTVIIAPIDGSPAQNAGLKPGDIIYAVNGQNVTGLSLNDVVNKILGPAGTKVTLTLIDPANGNRRDVTITREKITIKNVTWVQIPGTTLAHIQINVFAKGVTEDLKKALIEIQNQKLTGVVLDLRNNSGGLLEEGIGTASQFLSSGNVLQVKDANGKVENISVQPNGAATSIPLVVLINQGSASATEIVSGAIQDGKRGVLIGNTTFGTGTVLSQYSLSDGSALILAFQEWLTPNGRVIWHKGIVPDVKVQLAQNVYPLSTALEKNMTPDQFKTSPDIQLLKAVDLLAQQTNH